MLDIVHIELQPFASVNMLMTFCCCAEKHWHITGNKPLDLHILHLFHLHILHLFTYRSFHFEACGLPVSLADQLHSVFHYSLTEMSISLIVVGSSITDPYNEQLVKILTHLALAHKWGMLSMTPFQRLHYLIAYI